MSSTIKELPYNFFQNLNMKLNTFSHLKEKNITYFEHFFQSLNLAKMSLLATIIFIIHAIYPDILIETGSKILKDNLTKIQK
jgi:hypothetical protein